MVIAEPITSEPFIAPLTDILEEPASSPNTECFNYMPSDLIMTMKNFLKVKFYLGK